MPERSTAQNRAALLALLPMLAAGAAPAAGDEHMRLGTLEFASCEVGAHRASGAPTQAGWCTEFEVPENWDAPAGRKIRLHLAVARSQAVEADRDLVVFLDGGPGGAATDDYPAVAAALAPLRKHHHIVLLDQRGTGASNPLDCGDALALDTDKAAPLDPAHAGAIAGGPGDRVRRCVAKLAPRAAPQFYATTDAVRDLEAVRLALGGAPLDLVGISYGTRVAQQYAARYPRAVRSVVLDSAVPNRLVLLSEHARNLEDTVQRRLANCKADSECGRRFGDSYAILRAVHARLRREPQSVEVRDPQSYALLRRTLGADELATLVRFYLYSASTSALLPLLIDEAHSGRYGALLEQAQLVVGDVSEHLSGGMAASVLCTEDAGLLRVRKEDDDTLLGSEPVRSAIASCAAWPHRDAPAGFHEPFRSLVPVLVLAGEYDPVTPPRYGKEIVEALPNARLLLAKGQGHTVIAAGCMPRLVEEFVQHLEPARIDAGCLDVLGDTPAFLDANGAAP